MERFSEDDIQQMDEIAKEFENNLIEFYSDVETENSVQVILKGQLYIEHELRELLKRNLKNPKLLELDKFKFSSLNKLVFAIGLLPNEIYAVIKEINDLRNECAHNLKYSFGSKECKKIEDTLSGHFKKQYLNFLSTSKEPTNELKKLQVVLFAVWQTIKSENIIPDNIKVKLREKLKQF